MVQGVTSYEYAFIYISILGVILGIISIVYVIIVHLSTRKLQQRYMQLVRGESGINIEKIIQNINQNLDELKGNIDLQDQLIENHEIRLRQKSKQPVIKRYNAFGEIGNDLSYSIAILNEDGDGVVISSIYGREDSITFAKPIVGNQSEYKLTEEEQEVILKVN